MEVASYALLPLGLWMLFASRRLLPGWRGRLVFAEVFALALIGHVLIILLVPKETVAATFDYGMVGGAKYWMPHSMCSVFLRCSPWAASRRGSRHYGAGETVLADLLVIGGLAGAAVAMGLASGPREPEAFGWLGLPYAFPGFHLGVAVALIAFPHTEYLPALSEARPVRYLAKISFGIYIWHFLILELLRQAFAPGLSATRASPTPPLDGTSRLSFVLALIAGSLSWYGIEAPCLAWAKRRERHPPDALSARKTCMPDM